MKCQACGEDATQHITELKDGVPVEYHVCDKHADDLSQITGVDPVASPLRGLFSDADLQAALSDRDARNKVSAYVLPSLCLALNDPRPEVRIQGVFRLMGLGADADSVLGALREKLDDEDERVQKMASAAIEFIKGGERFF